jgi:hypothetical protein
MVLKDGCDDTVSQGSQVSWILWTSYAITISQHCEANIAHFLRRPTSTPSSSEQDKPPHQEAADQVVGAIVIAILHTRIYPPGRFASRSTDQLLGKHRGWTMTSRLPQSPRYTH